MKRPFILSGTPPWAWAAAAAALLGFLVSWAAFYPGVFTVDTLDQFEQSMTGRFTDWHPPAMALVWWALNKISVGSQLMLALQLALLWAGLGGVGAAIVRAGQPLGAVFPFVGFLPCVFGFEGVLWKDVVLAAAWLGAAGFVFARRAGGGRVGALGWTLVGAAFLYGALVRANSIFAAAPLAVYFAAPASRARLVALFLAAPIAMLALSAALNAAIVEPDQRQHPLSSLIVFDLGALSHAQGRNLLPGTWTATQARAIVGCYKPDMWDWYGQGDCDFVPRTLDSEDIWGASTLTRAWVGAIVGDPIGYLEHRAAYLNQVLRWIGDTPRGNVFVGGSAARLARLEHRPGAVYRGYARAAQALAGTPLYRPYFWLLASLFVTALSLSASPSPARSFAAAMGASGALYLLTYAVFGVSSDFRYAYWSLCAALAGGAALAACRWPTPPHRVLGAFAAAAAAAIAASYLR